MPKRSTAEMKEDIIGRLLAGKITREEAKEELGNYSSDDELDQYIDQYQRTGTCWS